MGKKKPTLYEVKPVTLIRKKKALIQKFQNQLTKQEKVRAKENSHSTRKPQWCGITIHIAENCPFSCQYCYIEGLGFKFDAPIPLELNGKELAFSLLNNNSFLPGKCGILIAIGGISEPFLFPEKVIEYIKLLSQFGNPIQFSTKSYLSECGVKKLKRSVEKGKSEISPLVTIPTLAYSSQLEGNAPTPKKRFKTIKNLSKQGFQPVLFLRPLIPGVNVKEAKSIMKKAKNAGAIGTVIGSFRVTKRILKRLRDQNLPTKEVKRGIKKVSSDQQPVPLFERKKLLKTANEVGLIPWRTTCCANSFQSNVPCPSACFLTKFCTNCPNSCTYPDNVPMEDEVEKALNYLRIKGFVKEDKVFIRKKGFFPSKMLVRNISRRMVEVIE